MIERSLRQNGADVLAPSGEEERLREQVKKLFRQLESQELKSQEKEDTFKQAIGLLAILSRTAVEQDLRPLVEQLWQEVKNGAPPTTLALLMADIKNKASQETLQALELEQLTLPTHDQETAPSVVLSDAVISQSRTVSAQQDGKPTGRVTTPPRTGSDLSLAQHEQEIEEKIRALLGSVIEQLHVEGQKGLYDKISAVKAALAESGVLRRLSDVRLQLADLLEHYRNLQEGERARLEDVLKELISKLAEIEKNVIVGLLASHHEAMAGNAEFAERLEGHVAEVQEVAQLKDLDAIRKTITSRTERMRAVIEAKREVDAERSASFEAKVRHLESQLYDTNSRLLSMTERACHDPFLEDVYNRFAFNEKLRQELLRFGRYQHAVSLVLFDMDRFKQVNDTYGHQAGDEALRTVAARVKPILREPDIFTRFGGDEFAVILPNTSLHGAVTVAERLRMVVCSSTFLYETHELQISLSMGVATARAGDSLETLLERADRALYLAKEKGRNQVRSEEELPSVQPSTVDKMVGFLAGKLSLGKGKEKA
jgi:diguanylate cyclase (GGDEF)-like protein